MNGFFAWLGNCLYPKAKEPEYIQEVLEAAEIDECDPSDIIWCDDCGDYHKGWW